MGFLCPTSYLINKIYDTLNLSSAIRSLALIGRYHPDKVMKYDAVPITWNGGGGGGRRGLLRVQYSQTRGTWSQEDEGRCVAPSQRSVSELWTCCTVSGGRELPLTGVSLLLRASLEESFRDRVQRQWHWTLKRSFDSRRKAKALPKVLSCKETCYHSVHVTWHDCHLLIELFLIKTDCQGFLWRC